MEGFKEYSNSQLFNPLFYCYCWAMEHINPLHFIPKCCKFYELIFFNTTALS